LSAQAAARIGGAAWEGIADFPELNDGSVAHTRADAFRPNPFGLHNVYGNVWEWCLDDMDFAPTGDRRRRIRCLAGAPRTA